jgi:uncharacterized protein (TIGR02145 family)/uncharacterized repeat protein (TIGR02543 family)
MNSNKTLTAHFKQATYTLNVDINPIGGGGVSRNSNKDVYMYNEQVTVTATAANCYTFTGWSGASTSKEASVTITMNDNKTLMANFQQNQYTLTTNVASSGGGTVSRNPNQTNYVCGTSVTVTATAANGYEFIGWSGDASGTTNPVTIIVNNNKTLTANFQQILYAVTISSIGTGASGNTNYAAGTSVTIIAGTAPPDYRFKNWTTTSSGVTFANANSATTTFTMPINAVTVTANFETIFITDNRDSKKYRTVRIGNQTWMAENLNYQPSTGNSWCYGNSVESCNKYGMLYDRNTAMTICPSGWHLSDIVEWRELVVAVGGYSVAGKVLKSTSGWDWSTYQNASGNGTDDYGFSALPSGYRNPNGNFYSVGDFGMWWLRRGGGNSISMSLNGNAVNEDGFDEDFGFSVRCVKDE